MRRGVLIAAFVLGSCAEPMPTPGTDAPPQPICTEDADCSDDLFCNGEEICDPADPAASPRGCRAATSGPCTGACDEATNRCATSSCETPDADGDGVASDACGGLDCDDTDDAIHPGATEICDPDDVDEDCFPGTYGARDRDGDGADDGECCNGSNCGTDCDDTREGVSPTSPEVCNTLDDDCDGSIDEEVTLTCYVDADRDRYAAAGAAISRACECPVGTTLMPPEGSDIDCNDSPTTGAAINPAVPEVCNGFDDDCDGETDELLLVSCWLDADRDGYAPMGATEMRLCSCPDGTTVRAPTGTAIDCNDANMAVSPTGAEGCSTNGLDDDCDGTIDDVAGDDWYRDCDLDGYGDRLDTTPVRSCVLPGSVPACGGGGGWARNDASDCDDRSAGVRPGTRPGDSVPAEACDNLDNDCNPATADGRSEAWLGNACDGADGDLCPEGVYTCGAGGIDMVCTDPAGETDVEACGGGDEDCDGTIDEPTDANAWCQARIASMPHATSSICVAGACTSASCDAGYNECDATVAGCESRCQWPGCDGTGCDDATRVSVWYDSGGQPGGPLSCAVRPSGRLVCWGRDGTGARTSPVTVPGITNAVDVDGPCVLRADGTVAQFRSPSTAFDAPGAWVTVSGLAAATQVSCGFYNGGCAVRSDRTVYCWGNGAGFGMLGNGSTSGSSGVVTGLSDAVEVRYGYRHVCARRAGGSVVCWGTNEFGQLGDGVASHVTCPAGAGYDCALTPVTVAGLTDAVEIATAIQASCARRASGAVVCWGIGYYLGDGLTSHGSTCPGESVPADCARTPMPIPGASAESRLVSSAFRTGACSARSAGGLACWGSSYLTPTNIVGFGNVTDLGSSVGGGGQWVCAIDETGLRCVGDNASGQLGDGTTSSRTSPVAVLPPP